MILILSVFVSIPIITSPTLDLKQQRENEVIYQKLAKARKEKEQKIYLTGHFDPAQREDFILIPPEYALGNSNQNKIYLRRETYEAYLQMESVAKIDGIDLKIASAARNFDYQKDIWDKKWTGFTLVDGKDLSKSILDGQERFKKILEYSSAPGTSRHHWGTEIDINNANPAYFESASGKKVYGWLVKNAYLFGFCQIYNIKGTDRPTGYNEEKWHWSYLPLSRAFTQDYKNLIRDVDIKGFLGEEHVPAFNLINDYVLSINPECT